MAAGNHPPFFCSPFVKAGTVGGGCFSDTVTGMPGGAEKVPGEKDGGGWRFWILAGCFLLINYKEF